MLCTRIRLTERRFVPVTRDPICAETNLAPQPTMSIIQRPCVIRNLKNNTNEDSNATPRILQRAEKRIKPPLIIFSLKMQPDTKTLAQHDVKRDPRRLPFFCEQYKQIKREQQKRQQHQFEQFEIKNIIRTSSPNENLSKNLIIRGVEILTDQNGIVKENNDNDCDETGGADFDSESDKNDVYNGFRLHNNSQITNLNDFIPKELQRIQLTDCCQCMRDVKMLKKELQIGQQIINEGNQLYQQDGLFLTINNGQVDGSYKTFKPPPFVCRRMMKRIPSPRTRQVINITMNSKK